MNHATPIELLLIALFVVPVLVCIRRAKRGENVYIRRIAGIDAIDEAIGRAVELGRPISFTTGLTGVNSLLYACLGILKHVAQRTARFGTRLLVPANDPEAIALTDATLQNAYRAANRLSQYDPTSVRYLSSDQFAFASGYVGLIQRENVASAFLLGSYAAESLILAEAGQRVGAVQIAGTISPEQIPFFIASCDYTLLGEELFAAGAFLSDDPVQRGSVRGQDIAKLGILMLILIGVVSSTWLSISQGVLKQGQELPLAQWFQVTWSDIVLFLKH